MECLLRCLHQFNSARRMTSPGTSDHLFQSGDQSPYHEFGWLGFMCSVFNFVYWSTLITNWTMKREVLFLGFWDRVSLWSPSWLRTWDNHSSASSRSPHPGLIQGFINGFEALCPERWYKIVCHASTLFLMEQLLVASPRSVVCLFVFKTGPLWKSVLFWKETPGA